MILQNKNRIEAWGGIECTINRVEDRFFNQLEKNNHFNRLEDIDMIAELGIKKLRYPVLWENVAPESPNKLNFKRLPEFLNKIISVGIEPIVTLLHHGSGPSYTNLLDPGFPRMFAAYASRVAQIFPWIKYYTPVNEPLTTARFSALYGIWYPHKKDDHSFCTALLNQCKAVILAMKEIRKINPDAKLIQTEDLGETNSTEILRYQAEFDNNRRWLTYDLLCGLVDEQHPMWSYFIYSGIRREELTFFLDNAYPPDVMGVNYYVTSERFLDHQLEKYPARFHGGNGKHNYADVETVRTDLPLTGLKSILKQTAKRYDIPLAITETHLSCSKEEQVKWLIESWNTAADLANSGIPIEAVTFWCLFGAYNWHNLLTVDEGKYESGVYEYSNNSLVRTILVDLIKMFTSNNKQKYTAGDQPGWWHREDRILYRIQEEKFEKNSTVLEKNKTENILIN
jgi:dTDP-4-dehydrorhamnose reductase